MKNFKQYIIEKFKISKDIESKEEYNIGDSCLMISLFREDKRESTVSLDILKIKDIKGNELVYEFKTDFCHVINLNIPATCNVIKDKANYWYSLINSYLYEIIIPDYDALNIIESIEKNNYKCKFFDILGYIPDKINATKDTEYNLVKADKKSFSRIPLEKEDINKLKENL